MQSSSFFINSHPTPKSVAILIWVTVIASLMAPIATFIFSHYFQMTGPLQWMTLSLWGIKQGWLWSVLTYCFVHSADVGISISLLFFLCFQMVLLWLAGTEIASRFGSRSFLILYLSAALISGLSALLFLFLFSSPMVIFGSGPPLYALLIVWTMLYPDLKLYFFFLINFKVKWIVASLLVLSLLISLSFGEYILVIADLTGILWGFLAGLFVWKLPNPYPIKLSLYKPKKSPKSPSNIIDINVFQEDDDAFMDRMLDKIARQGESALTKRECDRMQKISLRKQQEHKDL